MDNNFLNIIIPVHFQHKNTGFTHKKIYADDQLREPLIFPCIKIHNFNFRKKVIPYSG